MPLVFSPTFKVEKKKAAANVAFGLIDGYDFKTLYKAVGKRQDQQKYLRQHLRAIEFIRLYPYALESIDHRIDAFYKANKWDETDIKKVYYPKCCIFSQIFLTNVLWLTNRILPCLMT
jgi:hypothetical protein